MRKKAVQGTHSPALACRQEAEGMIEIGGLAAGQPVRRRN